MRLHDLTALLALAGLVLIVAFSGCSSRREKQVEIPDAAPIIAGAKFAESTVMGEVADVRIRLTEAVEASKGLASEPAVRAAVAQVETSLAAVEAAIAASPAADLEKLVADFHLAIAELRKVIADRDAEIERLKDADARFWNRVLIGLGIACTLGAVASGFFAASIPGIGHLLGPRIGVLLGACAGTCYLLAYVAAWTRDHPVKTGIAVATLLAAAAGLAWANRVNHRQNIP